MSTNLTPTLLKACTARGEQLFLAQQTENAARVDRLFAGLMAVQWLACVAAALWIAPLTWIGTESQIHPHLWAAVTLGGALALGPTGLTLFHPGAVLTRHVVAIAQMLFSALLIHVTGGRIETHFHVFGSLAFLAFYRERSVLVTATLVVAADHFLRGEIWPQSVFGSAGVSQWRWLEHAGWVVFEDTFLMLSIASARRAQQATCLRQAQLEASNEIVEATVQERTASLRASEARLRMSQDTSRLLIERALDAIVIIDPEGTIDQWNRAACEMFGRTKEEVLGHHVSEERVPPVVRAAYVESQSMSLSSDEQSGIRKELSASEPEGRECHLDVVIQSLHGLTFTLIRDITKQKQAQKELIDAHEAAVAASRLKTEFLANVSHELRTPMNGVIGMIDLLLESELTEEQRDYAETVHSSAEALLTILNDILDVSKIEAGMLVIEPLPFNLQQAIEDVGDLLAVKAAEKDIDLIVRYAPGTPRLLVGDVGRLRQIVTNLAGNAIKFTENGQVLIEVECDAVDGQIACLEVSVSDSGIGIPQNKLAHIFGKFTQADASTTRRYGGTGLGLAIAKQLVEMMGGSIGVMSKPGQGSTFWFRLRLPLSTETEIPVSTPAADLTGCRVLIVDDNAVNRRVLIEQCLSWPVQASAVSSGAEALRALQRARDEGNPFAIALIDYQMPEMDGFMLAAAVRAEASLKDTVLIMLSSMGQAEGGRLKSLGIAACLMKPTRAVHLLHALGTAWARIQRERARRDAATPLLRAALSRPIPAAPLPERHVLVAEDNRINQKVALKLLERLGCRVDIATNGLEAVEMALRGSYDLIFMDSQMPDLDGSQATAEIRRRMSGGARVPIVAMTANAMQGDRERFLAAGMDDYVPKPISLAALSSLLQRWIPERRADHRLFSSSKNLSYA